jgi:transmembrane sensor
MHHFLNYEVEDFVMDDTFRNWVLRPNYELEAIIRRYLEHHPDQKNVIEEARIIVLSLQVQEKTLPQKEWDEIYSSFETNLHNIKEEKVIPVKPIARHWGRYAAAALLTTVAASAAWLYISFKKQNATQQYIYATTYGEVKKIVLPDSSTVTLNANSKLTLTSTWNDASAREVWLDGEAFFEVTKKPNRAQKEFVVHTPELDVQVLGTKFDVKTVREFTRVVLAEGKVNIQSPRNLHSDIMMLPGDAVELKTKQVIPVKKTVQPQQYNAWKDKKFILNNTSLKEIGNFIEEYYGVEVRFENEELMTVTLDGTSLPIDDEKTFLSIIEKATGGIIIKTTKEIIIKK